MNHGPLIFLGSFLAMACSWFGLILMPQLQIGRQQSVVLPETGQLYPAPRPGAAAQGAQVYRANGCYYCHSQQVRQSDTLFNVTPLSVHVVKESTRFAHLGNLIEVQGQGFSSSWGF